MSAVKLFTLFLGIGSFLVSPIKRKRFHIMEEPKGKNKPCPCGSGKKYKICCLKKGRRVK